MSVPTAEDCALITGASAGLGEEFARQLAPHCARLILVARREDRLEQLSASLRERHPALKVRIGAVDLTRAQARHELIEAAAGTWAPDLLVNNAGMGDSGDFAGSEWKKVQQLLDLNIQALTHLTHGFLPPMMAKRRGAIVNVSSLASLLPIPDFAVYAASKAYVTSFSEALRLEVRSRGVSVLAVCPGPVHTDFDAVASREGGAASSAASSREFFYVPRERVVRESLHALRRDRARVYPGWQIGLAAAGISLLPLVAIRSLMARRPRSVAEGRS